MVCKEEVVHWFHELESYKRIDAMCTLLNMCLPFELRYFGTCLEELGARDFKEFRSTELRVNNPNDLAKLIEPPQMSDPSVDKDRRRLAFYCALMRACSRQCGNEIFEILYSWSNDEFLKHATGDALQELLLIYMMATNHPVFSFEQRTRCGEIFNKLIREYPEDVAVDSMNASNAPPIYSMPHTSNMAQLVLDQNRGSQIENIAPHPVHAENAQQPPSTYQQNEMAHNYSSQASNVTSSTRSNQPGQRQTPPPPPQQTQSTQPIQQTPTAPHIKFSHPTNLTYSMQDLSLVDGTNPAFVNNEGIPIMRKSESGSASSIESIEDTSPPDTPQTDANTTTSSGVSSSSSFKKHRVRSGSKSSTSSSNRHKINMSVQTQPHPMPQQHLIFGSGIPQIAGEVLHQTNAVTQPTTINTSPAVMSGFSIAPTLIYQQYPPQTTPHQIQKSQMPPYQYHTQTMQRVITTHATTTVQQAAAYNNRMPSNAYHMPPNGEVIQFQFASPIPYLQPQPGISLQARIQPTTSNQTPQHLPTITSLSSKSNQTAMLQPYVLGSEANAKPNVSCFNCGSSTHIGPECQESTMDGNRGMYKLDYSAIIVSDAVPKTSPDLVDNGNSSVKSSNETIAHIAPSVVNK